MEYLLGMACLLSSGIFFFQSTHSSLISLTLSAARKEKHDTVLRRKRRSVAKATPARYYTSNVDLWRERYMYTLYIRYVILSSGRKRIRKTYCVHHVSVKGIPEKNPQIFMKYKILFVNIIPNNNCICLSSYLFEQCS